MVKIVAHLGSVQDVSASSGTFRTVVIDIVVEAFTGQVDAVPARCVSATSMCGRGVESTSDAWLGRRLRSHLSLL